MFQTNLVQDLPHSHNFILLVLRKSNNKKHTLPADNSSGRMRFKTHRLLSLQRISCDRCALAAKEHILQPRFKNTSHFLLGNHTENDQPECLQ
jgi:hypothetical protein